jgi:myosin heavy subunit
LSDSEYSHDYRKRLERNFKKLSSNGFLEKVKFQEVMVEEVVDSAIKKAQYDTLQRWEDLTQLGVLEEVWDACFGFEKKYISFTELLAVFETTDEHKSEAEKLLDLCSEDEALRNHAYDLEQCLQSTKDMLAAADIMVEEQGEKLKALEEEMLKTKRECEQLQKQSKDLEVMKTKVKNMESEHRLLKRDFDLVFATNKSVQKKMERAELENHALRKSYVTLANQIEKIEREKADGAITNFTASPATAVMPLHLANANTQVSGSTQPAFIPTNDQAMQNFYSVSPQPPQPVQPPHMVWDPSVRALVAITGEPLPHRMPPRASRIVQPALPWYFGFFVLRFTGLLAGCTIRLARGGMRCGRGSPVIATKARTEGSHTICGGCTGWGG